MLHLDRFCYCRFHGTRCTRQDDQSHVPIPLLIALTAESYVHCLCGIDGSNVKMKSERCTLNVNRSMASGLKGRLLRLNDFILSDHEMIALS